MGDQHGHAGGAIGRQGAAGIEAEPADPQHAGTGHGHGQIMREHRAVRESAAPPKHERRYQGRHPGVDVDHNAAGKVHHAALL